jgi:ribosomal protein S4
MSQRPLNRKKANQLRKLLRKKPAARINLVHFLKDRRYAQTTGAAEKLILDGRVTVDGEPIGIGQIPVLDQKGEKTEKDMVFPLVLAENRDKIVVT